MKSGQVSVFSDSIPKYHVKSHIMTHTQSVIWLFFFSFPCGCMSNAYGNVWFS